MLYNEYNREFLSYFGEIKTVVIPACNEHNGLYSQIVQLVWICPVCGQSRGKPYSTISYDGSRRLAVNGWQNPCGHIDKYSAVRKEAKENNLN